MKRHMRIVSGVLALLCTVALPLSAFAQQDKLGRSPSRRPVIPACSRNSSAAWRCCIRTGSFKRARRSKRSCNRTPPAPSPTGALRSICLATRWPPRRRRKISRWPGKRSRRRVQSGRKRQRERDWIEALSAYYRDHEKVPVETRLLAYTKAMEQVTQRYPDDFEAWVFYALTLQASAPKADKTYANQLKSAAILERLLQQQPEHPGVAHFLIHAYDYPPLAEKGLPAARRYAGLAPAASHARHMPSHIYSMVGLWEESIASNRFALEIQPDYYHAVGFYGLCASAACAGRQGQGDDGTGGGYGGHRDARGDLRQLHGACRHARPLCARARRLERRRRSADHCRRSIPWPTP